MERRQFIKILSASAATACPTCLAAVQALAAEKEPGHATAKPHGNSNWTYQGAEGPDNWGELSPRFKVCDLGVQQSPVDLKGEIKSVLDDIDISYQSGIPLRVINNGHTIQVNTDPGSKIAIAGKTYKLLQFHFHHPSEHLLNGKAFQMEAHFVHASEDGKLAVLGVFINPGRENALLSRVWSAMPQEAGPGEKGHGTVISPADLIPVDKKYFRYHGSLTTPPCSEIVLWSVFRAPLEASMGQIKTFAKLFPMNARPAQELNRRFLLNSL